MTREDILLYLQISTPFSLEEFEVEPKTLDLILMKSFLEFNKHIVKDCVVDLSTPSFNELAYSQFPTQDYTYTNFTLDNIETSSSYNDFLDLVTATTLIYLSNFRRAGIIGELPIDLNGENLLNQGNTLLELTVKKLENSSKPFL